HRETKQPLLLRQVMDYDAIRTMEEYFREVTRNGFRNRLRAGWGRRGRTMPFGHQVAVLSPLNARHIGLSTREDWNTSNRLRTVFMPGMLMDLTLDEFYAFYPSRDWELKQRF